MDELTAYKLTELERKYYSLLDKYQQLEKELERERQGHNKTFIRLVNLRLDFHDHTAKMKESLDKYPSYDL